MSDCFDHEYDAMESRDQHDSSGPSYWREPGKRKYQSDKEFVSSVLSFYSTRGYITAKQREAVSMFMSPTELAKRLKALETVSPFTPDEETITPTNTTVFGDYKMNLSDTFLTENPDFKFVSIVFAPYTGTREYTYKTLLAVEKDDFVVVQTPSGEYQCVQVRTVMEPLEAELSPNINYKWIVQKVDLEHYEQCRDMEKSVQLKLRKAEARKRQKELRESASEFLSEEERAETAKLVRL